MGKRIDAITIFLQEKKMYNNYNLQKLATFYCYLIDIIYGIAMDITLSIMGLRGRCT